MHEFSFNCRTIQMMKNRTWKSDALVFFELPNQYILTYSFVVLSRPESVSWFGTDGDTSMRFSDWPRKISAPGRSWLRSWWKSTKISMKSQKSWDFHSWILLIVLGLVFLLPRCLASPPAWDSWTPPRTSPFLLGFSVWNWGLFTREQFWKNEPAISNINKLAQDCWFASQKLLCINSVEIGPRPERGGVRRQRYNF